VSTQPHVVTADVPPGVTERRWSPISSMPISGTQDVVLVDTFITVEQNRQLAEWVEKSGKNQIAIYATHGHGDHLFWREHNSAAIPERAVRGPRR
jgi:glyoxylase-like metal-dependent hydrolase (beta-lactamase superfamily II)